MKQDKTDIFQSLENQKKNDFKQIIEQYENKILLIQSEYEKIQKESKEDWESRIKSIQEQLDLEKSNTALVNNNINKKLFFIFCYIIKI